MPRPTPLARSLRTTWALVLLGLIAAPSFADDPRDFPSRLGRLLGFGPRPSANANPNGGMTATPDRPYPGATMPGGAMPRPGLGGPAAIETPRLPSTAPAPRLVPQPRTTRPMFEAEPLLTRVGVARSDNGAQFALFLHVFADGTVVDAEGVHRVPPDLVRAVSRAIYDGDLLRRRGHCGAPSTDYVEQFHVTTFERSGRNLKANTFSYTSNPQGCDPSVGRLHQAVEAIVLKLAGSGATPGAVTPAQPASAPVPAPAPALPTLGAPVTPNLPVTPMPTEPTPPTNDVPPLLPPVSAAPSATSIPLTPVPD